MAKSPHPLNSPVGKSTKWCIRYDADNNNKPLNILCHVVYAILGLTVKRLHDLSSFLCYGLYFTGIAYFYKSFNRKFRHVAILNYHSIPENNLVNGYRSCLDLLGMAVPVSVFESHIQQVKSRYTVIGLDQLIDSLTGNSDIPNNAVVLTFDDGLLDNYTQAFPVLKRYDCKGSFFIIGDAITGERLVWPHHLYWILDRLSGKPFVFDWKGRTIFKCRELHDANKFFLIGRLKEIRAQMEAQASEKLLRDVCEQNGVEFQEIEKQQVFMRHQHLRDISEAGHIIGAHSMTHAGLSGVGSAVLKSEIRSSKATIEEFCRPGVLAFAYPYGTGKDFNAAVIEELRENDFDCALTTIEGLNGTGADRFRLKRIETGCFTTVELDAHLSGAIGDIKGFARNILRRN